MSDKSDLVFTATESDFESAVVQKSRQTPVVVDFWATWCGPCRALTPILERLVTERGGDVLLAKVNTDEAPDLAAQHGIQVLPTVIAFRDGKAILSFEGLLREYQIREFLDSVVPSQAEWTAREAAALEKTNPAQAEKLYRQALTGKPDLPEALLGLARLLIDRHQESESNELLERVVPGGEHGAEAERLTALLWLRRQAQAIGDERTLSERLQIDPQNAQHLFELGAVRAGQEQYPEALDMLLQAGKLDRKLASNQVRETMVKVFHVIGVRSTLADEYRDKLSAILY